MAKMELDDIEMDGFRYPNVESGLGEYGILWLRHLHERKPERYRDLLLTGKLAPHCKAVDIWDAIVEPSLSQHRGFIVVGFF